MPPLDGRALEELTALLNSAFTVRQLEQRVRFSYGDQLFGEYVPAGLDGRDTVFALLEELGRRGTTEVLLRAVLKARPKRDDIRETIKRLCPAALAEPADARSQVAAVVTGVRAMQRLLAQPSVRQMVAGFQTVLVEAADQVDQLNGYKILHDILHKVQFRFFYQVGDAARRFKTDPVASDNLAEYLADLRELADRARPVAGKLPDVPAARGLELAWIEEFDAALAKLAAGRDGLDDQRALVGVRCLKKLLAVEPARLNRMLCLLARSIPLPRLLDAFTAFAALATGAAPDTAAAALDARNGLCGLQPRLQSRVKEHTLWQDLEKDLWLLEEYLLDRTAGARSEEVRDLWSGIKSQVTDLVEIDPAAEWANAIRPRAASVETALASPPPGPDAADPALYTFRDYRRSILDRFHRVDDYLMQLCAEVITLGQPLRDLAKEVLDAA